MNKIELKDFAGGALQEQFEKSFEKIIENLQDPNTSFKAAREISIKLKFAQNERRDDVSVVVSVGEKLAPQEAMTTSFAIGKNLATGEMYAEEYGKGIRGQMSINDYTTESEPETEATSTESVIDFRRAAAN